MHNAKAKELHCTCSAYCYLRPRTPNPTHLLHHTSLRPAPQFIAYWRKLPRAPRPPHIGLQLQCILRPHGIRDDTRDYEAFGQPLLLWLQRFYRACEGLGCVALASSSPLIENCYKITVTGPTVISDGSVKGQLRVQHVCHEVHRLLRSMYPQIFWVLGLACCCVRDRWI
jgi:hypothetical protein